MIDGGAGSDVANISISKAFSGFTVGVGSMKNIETVNLTNTTTTNYDFTARGISGVTAYSVKGSIDVFGLSSLTPKVTYSGLSTAAADTVTIGFDTEVVAGTSDAFTVGVNTLGKAAVTTAPTSAEVAHNVKIDGVENLTVEATGANFIALTSDDMKALTVSGEGSLKLNEVGTAAKTVVATNLKGALDINLGEATGVTSVKGGAVNDVIRVTTGDLTGNAVVAGGDGTDTLRVSTNNTTTVAYAMDSVETVYLDGVANTLNFSGSNATGITKIYVGNAATAAIVSTFSDMGAGAIAVEVQAAGAGGAADVSVDSSTSATVGVVVSASAVSDATAETATDLVTFTKATSVGLTVAKYGNYTGTLTANKATAVTATITGTANATVASAAMTSLTVNQANTTAANAATLTINKGTGTASKLASLDLTIKGGLTITTTDDTVALESLKAKTDVAFTYNTAADLDAITTVDLSGDADASAVTLGDLGATTLAYGITANATGLKAGLTIGTIDTAANQAISLGIGGVNGAGTVGAITVAGGTTGSITLNANGFGDAAADTLSIGNLSAKTVTVDVNGSTGNVTIGTISGTDVSLKATTAEGTLTVGGVGTDVTAKTSLVYYGPDLDDQDVQVSIASGSTAFTGDIKGGVLGDNFDFTSASTGQTGITLTGALGAGTNTLTVTSSTSTVTTGQTIDVSGLTGVATSTLKGGTYADTIKGTSGNDTIYGGAGGDTLTGGGGNDKFVLELTSQTAALHNASVTNAVTKADGTKASFTAGYVITGGHYVSTTGMDKITDFNNGDVIITNTGETAHDSIKKVGDTLASGDEGYLYGTYSASAGTFTFSASGADTLYIFDTDGDAGNDYFGAMVLIGYAQVLTVTGATTGLVGSAS